LRDARGIRARSAVPPGKCSGATHCSLIDKFPGGYRGRVPPVPIPNTEVKPATADGTARATVWESRSLPGLFLTRPHGSSVRLFFFVPPASGRAHTRRHDPISSPARRHPPARPPAALQKNSQLHGPDCVGEQGTAGIISHQVARFFRAAFLLGCGPGPVEIAFGA
jgi:hypothetical protein